MQPLSKGLKRIDHLAFAASDLETGKRKIEELFGVSVQDGGRHPNWGTHNVLIALGPDIFLEIIAPDPKRSNPAVPSLFGLDRLSEPKLAAWAAKENRLTERLEKIKKAGIPFGQKLSGRRQKPDGAILSWELSDPLTVVGEGVVPFLIDWGNTPHPAQGMPQERRLIDFQIEHPEPARIKKIMRLLDLGDIAVSPGSEPALIAHIQTPQRVVELR